MSEMRTVAVIVAAVFLAPTAYSSPVRKQASDPVGKQLDEAWEGLLSTEELVASRAMFQFLAHPEASVPYLQERLPALWLDGKRADQLLADLGSDKPAVARAAFDELAYFDPRLLLRGDDLSGALVNGWSGRRLAAILCDMPMDSLATGDWHFNPADSKTLRFTHAEIAWERYAAREVADIGRVGRNSHWTRAIRGIAILENIGGPRAITALEQIARGHPDAAPTRAAKEATRKAREKR
jgi:hypothetical protein